MFSDVWSYNISSRLFTWIGGTRGANQPAMYPAVQGLGVGAGLLHANRAAGYFNKMWVAPSGDVWFGMDQLSWFDCNGRSNRLRTSRS
jgi:hypothetical protein